jgi:NAD(P)-dependent dehydrogenase (short-subunit alcohol dehydrogenase family)/acyl carrier protein
VQGVLLEVIAEKTGYPADMLEMGMTLDADLGIDSIKRVEILSALQEKLPEAPPVKPEHLGTLHTLEDIAAFLASEGAAVVSDASQKRSSDTPLRSVANQATENALERSVVHPVPLAMTGRVALALPAGAEVYVAGQGVLADLVAAGLRARGVEAITGTCSALTGNVAGLIVLAPEDEPTDDWLRDALFAVQRAGPSLKQANGVLVTVARLDGAFGLAGTSRREPIDGGLAGLAKTVRHEWPTVHVRALDLAPELAPDLAARAVVEEFFLSGPVEVGVSMTGRVTLQRRVEPLPRGTHRPWQPGDVVVVSGGARGVTAEAAVELARAFQPTLVLLGRSPEPGPADELESLSDETALKRELSRRNPGLAPRAVGEQVKTVLAQRELRANLERIEKAGARVLYRSVDVRDAAAVAHVLDEVRRQAGPIRALVHGAGVLADARIEDKTPAQFDSVFATKVGGLRSLLAGLAGDELRALVLFSSSTARFGRTGQVDYAMANEVLNKLAWHEACRRTSCQVVSINWGPWAGGMVTPGLRDLFAREGIGLIPLDAGARLLADELRLGPGGPREVVVLASPVASAPGVLPRGADATPLPATPLLSPALPTAFERVLDVDEYPVLADHVLDGRPVLPTVLMLEWLAHAAIVQNPGLLFHGCDDLRVLQGVTLDGPEPPTLRVGAGKTTRRDGFFVASAELRSTRPDGREVLHARAEIVLAGSLPGGPAPRPAPPLAPYEMTAAEAYRQGLLFHGPRLHAITHVEGCDTAGVIGQVQAAAPPNEWLRRALRPHWLADPLVLDGALQLVILWTRQQRGAANLPCHIRRYRQWRRGFPADGARVVVFVERSSERLALCDMDFVDAEGRLIARLEGYECVIDPALERAYRRNAVVLV